MNLLECFEQSGYVLAVALATANTGTMGLSALYGGWVVNYNAVGEGPFELALAVFLNAWALFGLASSLRRRVAQGP